MKKMPILVIVIFLLLSGCSSDDSKYEKDLYSVFHIPIDSTIENIIEFELSEYNHSEYDIDTDGKGRTKVCFAPCIQDGATYYKHIYRFDSDTQELQVIEYGNILSGENFDDDNICEHIEVLKNNLMDISSVWDEENSKNLMFTMYGNIDGSKCKIEYYESINLIALSIE